MKMSRVKRFAPALLAVLGGALAIALAARIACAEDADPWAKGAQWISFRGGYVKSLSENAADGNVGYAMSYSRMVSKRLMFGASVDHDLLGKFGGASQIEIPMSAELLWHLRWKTPVRPFFGLGFGAYFSKTYRTGDDHADFQPGGYFAFGLNTPIDHNSLLGVHVKLASVSSDADHPNPVFGRAEPSAGRVAAKLAWTRVIW